MRRQLTYNASEKTVTKIMIALASLKNGKYETMNDIEIGDRALIDIKGDFKGFLNANFSRIVVEKFEHILHSNQGINDFFNFNHIGDRRKSLLNRIQKLIDDVDRIWGLLRISDPFVTGNDLIAVRAEWTVEQKKDFLLRKLYEVRKSNKYWSPQLIFLLNDVSMDDDDEGREVAESLRKNKYITREDYYSYSDVKITVAGKGFIEKSKPSATKKTTSLSPSSTMLDIFISHSSEDAETAKLIIDLIKTAINIPAKKIRCTSVDGYRLPTGASTDEQLKTEVNDCKVLIGVISQNSMNSAYVMFELGARWGQSKPLFPIVIGSGGVELLRGPLAGINAVNLSNISQVYQFIDDLASKLDAKCESSAVYAHKADDLVKHTLQEMLPVSLAVSKGENKRVNSPSPSLSEKTIKEFCEMQWPDDYAMRLHCVQEQTKAIQQLNSPQPNDIPVDVHQLIVKKSIQDWPDDFTMQLHSRNEQIDAYRKLNGIK